MKELNIIPIVNRFVGSTSRFGIVDIVVVGGIAHIFILAAVLDVLLLILGIALFGVSHTDTRYLLADGSDRMNICTEGAGWLSALAKHVTDEVCRDFLLLIVVGELDAESVLQG